MISTAGFVVGCLFGGVASLWFGLAGATESDSGAFPESRFGAPPVEVTPGTGKGYAAKKVEEMEEREDTLPRRFVESGKRWDSDQVGGSQAATRQPAGMMAGAPSATKERPEGLSIQAEINKKGVQEVSLIAGDLGFFPRSVFVTKDVPVRLYVTGASKNSLCIMLDSFQVRKQVRSTRIEEITFMPQTAGTFRFYCPVNGIEGQLVVREASSVRGGVATP